jgi:hypothetical protein
MSGFGSSSFLMARTPERRGEEGIGEVKREQSLVLSIAAMDEMMSDVVKLE